jgi:pyruvate/2-oxoacid:ferredoxin oxidoreductase alpha subunit
MTDGADLVMTGMGSSAAEAVAATDMLRAEGIKAGVVGIRVFRPFPRDEVAQAFSSARAIVVFEKAISYGYEGALCSDLKAALYGTGVDAPIHNYVAGLGGRDVKPRELAEAAGKAAALREGQTMKNDTFWLNCYTG